MPLVEIQGTLCLPHFTFSCDGKVHTSGTAGFLRGWVPGSGRFTKNAGSPRAVPFDGDMAGPATHSHTQTPAQTTLQNPCTAKPFLSCDGSGWPEQSGTNQFLQGSNS